jgi:hypothetical protein
MNKDLNLWQSGFTLISITPPPSFLGSTRVWTQEFMFTRQTLYYLSHASSPALHHLLPQWIGNVTLSLWAKCSSLKDFSCLSVQTHQPTLDSTCHMEASMHSTPEDASAQSCNCVSSPPECVPAPGVQYEGPTFLCLT